MHRLLPLLVAAATAACLPVTNSETTAPSPTAVSATNPPSSTAAQAPAQRVAGPAAVGVTALASLAKSDWPCSGASSHVAGESRMVIDYAGSPDRCYMPPHLWLPGCPTRVSVNNVAHPKLAVHFHRRYDDSGRLVAEAGPTREDASLDEPTVAWSGPRTVSTAGGARLVASDGMVQARGDDGEIRVAAFIEDSRLKMLMHYIDGKPAIVEAFAYGEQRLDMVVSSDAKGESGETLQYDYSCR